jgi:putative addiction module component (TIGR02574 family)
VRIAVGNMPNAEVQRLQEVLVLPWHGCYDVEYAKSRTRHVMNALLKELEYKALQLNPHDRSELIGALIDSLEGGARNDSTEIVAAWDSEIEKRIVEMEAGRLEFVDADEAMEAIRRRVDQHR